MVAIELDLPHGQVITIGKERIVVKLVLITFGLKGHAVMPTNIVACNPADTGWVPIKANAISSMAIDPVSIDDDIGGTLINGDSTCIPVVP